MRTGLAVALVVALAVLAGCAPEADAPANDGVAMEKSMREALGIADATLIEYQGEDGKPLEANAFMSRMGQPGIAAVPDKSQPGKVVLRLMRQPAEPAPSGSGHLPTLDAEDLDGRRVRNADLAGRHTLVTFYFATCVPCIKEVPALNTYRRAHPDLNYLAVTYESVAEARAFVAKHGLEWPVIADARPFLDAAGVRGFPTYLLVSPDGRILGRESGLPLDPKEEIPGLASLTAFVAAHLP